jgi:hypothetical protein
VTFAEYQKREGFPLNTTQAPVFEKCWNTARKPLDAIHAILNAPGRWTPETLEAIADVIRKAGYTITE